MKWRPTNCQFAYLWWRVPMTASSARIVAMTLTDCQTGPAMIAHCHWSLHTVYLNYDLFTPHRPGRSSLGLPLFKSRCP